MGEKETFVTGRDCDSYCTRCKMDLAHTVVAMVRGAPVQVKCNTCGSFHRYRLAKSAKNKGAKRPVRRSAAKGAQTRTQRARKTSGVVARTRWEGLLEERDKDAVRPYKVTDEFKKDDIVQHSKFGLGIVVEELPSNRVRVLFQDSERILITCHGR